MPANVIASIGGNTVNGATSWRVVFPSSDPVIRRKTIAYAKRRNLGPVIIGRSWEPLEFKLRISASDSATSYATFKAVIEQWFQPWTNATTVIAAVWHDGTPVYIDAELIELRPVQDAAVVQTVMYEASCIAPYPVWQAVTAKTNGGANPATVTNAGNTNARPSIALTTGTHKTRRSCTVTPVVGWPFTAYPVLFVLNDAVATSANTFVLVNGLSVPTYMRNSGGATSEVWALIDCDELGTATAVEIIYGTGLVNQLGQTLDPSDFLSNSTTTNARWAWSEWAVTTHANYCGVWLPDTTGYHNAGTHRLTSDGASVVLSILSQGTSDFDSITVRIPTGIDVSASSPEDFLRTLSGSAGTNAQAYARYKYKNSDKWVDSNYVTRTDGAVSTDLTGTDGAIALAIGLENDGGTVDACTLTIVEATAAGAGPAQIDILNPPVVVVGATTNMDYYSGTYVVGGYTITFSGTVVPDGTLTIDALNRSVMSSASGPMLNRPTWSDPGDLVTLIPGVNTITDGIGASDTITHRDSYV